MKHYNGLGIFWASPPSTANQSTWLSNQSARILYQPYDDVYLRLQRTQATTVAVVAFRSASPDYCTRSYIQLTHTAPPVVHRLFHGNFVLELAVPTKLVNLCLHKENREITHMRYSAATGDLNDFTQNGFALCLVHYDLPYWTELFIIMTIYNEDDSLFTRAIDGVIKKITMLARASSPQICPWLRTAYGRTAM